MDRIYTRYEIWHTKGYAASVEWSTNDDNDDGYPDGEMTLATYHFPTLEKALEFSGKSRIGLYGQSVTVYLNGQKV